MTLNLISVVLDARDPALLARFWAAALGWDIDETPDEIGLAPTDGTRFGILFEPNPEEKLRKNRIHLDLASRSIDEQRARVARLIELGARRVDVGQGADAMHVVLADPEGNEFCVLEPENAFVADGSVLGSITCDGSSRAVGQFWSDALGWPLVWDRDDETAICAPDGGGQFITWGPPLMPKHTKNRLHLDIAPPADGDQDAEVQRLLSMGAARVDIGQNDVPWVVMADPDGNEFCVLTAR